MKNRPFFSKAQLEADLFIYDYLILKTLQLLHLSWSLPPARQRLVHVGVIC